MKRVIAVHRSFSRKGIYDNDNNNTFKNSKDKKNVSDTSRHRWVDVVIF
jgi:hypothetical protein